MSYSTYDLTCEVEENKLPVPDHLKAKVVYWLMATCINQDGTWSGGNVFWFLNTLMQIQKDNIKFAVSSLDEPERTETLEEGQDILFSNRSGANWRRDSGRMGGNSLRDFF